MIKNRIKIESKDKDDNPITVYVTRPSRDDNSKAQILASKVFKEAVLNGALVRKTLEDVLVKQGVWNSEKQAEVDKIDEDIREKLTKLKAGGIKLTEARDLAIEVRIARMNKSILLSERNVHDEFTAESQSENARFDYLVSVCVKDEEGKSIFKDLDDYQERSSEPFAGEAAAKLATIIHGLDENWESNLPENKFLKKYEFVDEDLRLVNKEGKHVTKDGKLINNDFRYINEQGEFIDINGKRIDEDGLPVVEFSPFLDDQGKPIVEEQPVVVDKSLEVVEEISE